MEGRFSDQTRSAARQPARPVRTRDDVDKNLANAIVAWIRRIIRNSAALGRPFC